MVLQGRRLRANRFAALYTTITDTTANTLLTRPGLILGHVNVTQHGRAFRSGGMTANEPRLAFWYNAIPIKLPCLSPQPVIPNKLSDARRSGLRSESGSPLPANSLRLNSIPR